jgi:hypothetical protein
MQAAGGPMWMKGSGAVEIRHCPRQPNDGKGLGADVHESAKRRFWRSFLIKALSDKAKLPMHHGSDVCGYVGGLGAHGARESCFGCPSLPVARTRPRADGLSTRCRRGRAAAGGHEATFVLPLIETFERSLSLVTDVSLGR